MKKQDFPMPQEDQALQDLFRRAGAIPLTPVPHLATRVLAHVHSRAEARRKLRFWQFLSFGLAASFVAALIFMRPAAPTLELLEGQIHKPQVVMLKIQEAQGADIASAEIELPEGVFFYSESFPGLKEKRELKLAWTRGAKPYLPFVVRAEIAGAKTLKVRFRSESGQVLLERDIQIRFVGEKS